MPKNINARLGDIVIKQYGEKTIISKYPDMRNVVASNAQLQKRSRFAEAVAYAKTINNSTILRADYIKRVGNVKSVYQHALKHFLSRES